MPALEMLVGNVTAPGATITAYAANPGNSFTVRNFSDNNSAYLLTAWNKLQDDGQLRIHSPKMHDNIQGLDFYIASGVIQKLMEPSLNQPLFSQEELVVEGSGSATGGDIEIVGLLVYYESLPGIQQELIGIDELNGRSKNLLTVRTTITAGTSGDYSGEQTLIADNNLLKGDTKYALLGAVSDSSVGAIRIRGSDSGNLGVGMPIQSGVPHLSSRWFIELSLKTGLPMIPVFDSDNRDAIFVDVANDENALSPNISWIFAELS